MAASNATKDKTGKSLEQAVGRIQQMFDPNCEVSYRERIKNKLGIEREFDVVIRGKFAGHSMLGVIECKDWSNKVGTPELDAFITKSADVNAGLRLMVSPKGFTQPAIEQAKHVGVGIFSLLPNDASESGFCVGVLCYARSYTWQEFQVNLRFPVNRPEVGSYTSEDVLYNRKPIVNWLLCQLSTTYNDAKVWPEVELRAKLLNPIQVSIKDATYFVSELTLSGKRKCQYKKRFMQLTGDGIFDWRTYTMSAPSGGSITISEFRSDLSDWDDFDGEIPEIGSYQFIIDRFWGCIDPDSENVPALPGIIIECRNANASDGETQCAR